jgi:HlyD family secretion protein
MDVKRDPAILRKKRIRQAILWSLVGVALIVVSAFVARLRPAAPSVPWNTLWFGTVKRGPMVREVRGAGTLVPEEIRWVSAMASGRVEKIVLRPGAQVKPGTVIVELSNPDLLQQVNNAELQWKSAKAQLENAKANARSQRLSQEAALSNARSQYNVAQSNLEANQKLFEQGLVADLTIKQLQAAVNQAKNSQDLAQKQLEISAENEQSQLAPQEAAVNQQKVGFDLVSRQLEALHVKSTMSGQLQLVSVEEGQQVGPGLNLARVSDPTHLKAQIRISETQTKDLAVGQAADVDTRNGHVKGHVTRIDPASQGGTVGVDVMLDEALPPGARPDLSVDGTIELQRLENILYVEHPSFGQEDQTAGLFKVLPNGPGPVVAGQEAGHEAVQTSVKFGRGSVQYIEVKEGLKEGDRVILSDMSQYDRYDRVKVN